MNRTLHGIGKLDAGLKAHIHNGAKNLIEARFKSLANMPVESDRVTMVTTFDDWHGKSCEAIVAFYGDELELHSSKVRMTYGQAQKWTNMTIKYCWLFGGEELIWLQPWLPAAHFSVDEVILRAAVAEKAVSEPPCEAWSKWNSEEQYQGFQKTLRTVAARQNRMPLELEAEWWEKYRRLFVYGEED
jgi:hypothetical protein